MKYFSFHHFTQDTYNKRFVELFGAPRGPCGSILSPISPTRTRRLPPINICTTKNQYYADIAASIQRVTEETILLLLHEAKRMTGSDNLCLAGGVMLNSVAEMGVFCVRVPSKMSSSNQPPEIAVVRGGLRSMPITFCWASHGSLRWNTPIGATNTPRPKRRTFSKKKVYPITNSTMTN